MIRAEIFIALLHYPVYNKRREVVASALTTMDLHDLARVAATYGLAGYYVVTPLVDQLELAEQMLDHWRRGWGATYNPDRTQALGLVRLAPDLDTVVAGITDRGRGRPILVATSAGDSDGPDDRGGHGPQMVSYAAVGEHLRGERPLLIIFGTAWGLTRELLGRCDFLLEPLEGPTEYNHLSVRSAAGIVVDRLIGRRE